MCSYALLYVHTPPYIGMPPWGANTPPYFPHTLHLDVLRGICMLREVVGGLLHVGHLPYMLDTSPIWVMPPHISYTSTYLLASLCICMFGGYLHVISGIFPLWWQFGGCSIFWGFGGICTSVKLWCLAVHPLGVH